MEKKNKKIVAMIMDRHYVRPESFIFTCNHLVIGELDYETNIVKDNRGNEYAPMLNRGLLQSEIPYCYNNIIELSDIKRVMGEEKNLKAALSEYEYICKKNVYCVSLQENGRVVCATINVENLAKSVNRMYDISEEESAEQEDEEQSESAKEKIDELIIDIINKKYSKEELEEIRERIQISKDDLENVLDTIDLQMEAMEENESFTAHYTKKRRKLKETLEDEDEEEIDNDDSDDDRIDINDLFNKVTKTLIAQDIPARRVIVEIVRKELEEKKKREGILLTGATGVGKTELMRLIAKYIDRPFHKIDSTKLTVPGYAGKDIEEELWDLYIECGRDKEKAEKAIIYFDEIDKKGSAKNSDVSGKGVLSVLLPFIEGTTYDACQNLRNSTSSIKIDTSNMTVILGGAFTDVYKDLLEKNMGFVKDKSYKPVYREATTKDFVEKSGMSDEFMGRVTVIKLNDLDVDDIKRVMLESDQSALKIQEEIFNKIGVKITFTDGYTTEVAKNAYEKKTGARGLNGVIDETTWQAFDKVYENPEAYEEVIISEDTVKDPSNFQLVKRKQKNKE